METNNFNEKESLRIISQMMQETREYIHKGVGNWQLLWGYLSVAGALCVYFGWQLTHSHWVQLIWWAIPLIGWPRMYIMTRRQPKKVVTQIDRMIGKVWCVIGITATIAPMFAFMIYYPILFVEALLISVGITITGLILNFKTFYIPGFISILLSFSLLWIKGLDQILIFALLFTVLLIIPGHIINYQVRKKLSDPLCSEN